MREAQHLSKIATKLYVIHRRNEFRAQKALVDLVTSKENVEVIYDSVVDEVLGEDKVSAVKLKNIKTNETKDLPVEALFVAIGHKPSTDFLKGELELDEKGYIKVTDEVFSSIPGIFIAGDVSDFRYRQAVTAAGAGTKATFEVEHYLENKPVEEITK